AAAGDHAGALCTIRNALSITEASGERLTMPELLRLHGEEILRADYNALTAAEALFRSALAEARRQGARAWELRAAVSLAGFLGRNKRAEEALALLAPVHDTVPCPSPTPDLQAARQLLLQLRTADQYPNSEQLSDVLG